MRSVEATQPIPGAGRLLPKHFLKSCAAHFLSGRLVKSRGYPLLRFPAMVLARQTRQFPTPFRDALRLRKKADQPKRIRPPQRQLPQDLFTRFRRFSAATLSHNVAAACRAGVHPGRYRIPIDERKAHSRVIRGYPGATARLRRADYGAPAFLDSFWRQALRTRPLLVAIHAQQISLLRGNKCDCAHINPPPDKSRRYVRTPARPAREAGAPRDDGRDAGWPRRWQRPVPIAGTTCDTH